MYDRSQKKQPKLHLKNERERRGWSQEKLADLIGTTQKIISRWERGESVPLPYYREKLCTLFSKDAEEPGFLETEQPATTMAPRETFASVLPLPALQSSTPTNTTIAIASGSERAFLQIGADEEPAAQTLQLFGPNRMPVLTVQAPSSASVYAQHGRISVLHHDTHITIEHSQDGQEMSSSQDGNLSRRSFLELCVGVPLLGFAPLKQALYDEELLALCSVSLPILWRLYFDGHRSEVEQVVPWYLARLCPLAEQAGPSQPLAAKFASQASQLASMCALHEEGFGSSMAHCRAALFYAQIADDPDIFMAALMRKVHTLYYGEHSREVSETLQEAALHLAGVSPLMYSRLYSELAADMALYGREQEFLRYQGLAQEAIPNDPSSDPSFAYTHTNIYILFLNEAVAHLELDRPRDAWHAIEQAEAHVARSLSGRRLELLLHQASIALACKDLELACDRLNLALEGSQTLHTTLRFNEAAEMYYHKVPARWKQDPCMRALAERFQFVPSGAR